MGFINGRAVAAWAALITLATPATVGAAAGHRTVTIKDIDFKPGKVTIKKGQSVRWVWRDGQYVDHNVTLRKLHKHSPSQNSGTYTVRFTRTGTYKYLCTLHLNMTGTVTVR